MKSQSTEGPTAPLELTAYTLVGKRTGNQYEIILAVVWQESQVELTTDLFPDRLNIQNRLFHGGQLFFPHNHDRPITFQLRHPPVRGGDPTTDKGRRHVLPLARKSRLRTYRPKIFRDYAHVTPKKRFKMLIFPDLMRSNSHPCLLAAQALPRGAALPHSHDCPALF